MRPIDADAAIEAVCEEVMDRFFVPPSAGYDVAEEALKKLPSIQPETNCSEIPNNSDTISRQQAIDAITEYGSGDTTYMSVAELKRRIEHFPSIQPKHKTGQWIPSDSELEIKCNKCGKSFSDYVNAGTGYMFLEETPNFCPNCGRKLRGEG